MMQSDVKRVASAVAVSRLSSEGVMRADRRMRQGVRQLLLARLEAANKGVLSDAALRRLAEVAARRLAESGLGYGEVNQAMYDAQRALALLAERRSESRKPMSAAALKRICGSGYLPPLHPWF